VRRILGIVASVVLLGAGTVLLVGYVRGAESRALAGEELVGVLVVDQAISAGATAEEIGEAVRLEQVPVKVAVDGAVGDLGSVAGMVAAVDLLPGEQVSTGRFADPMELRVHAAVEPPPGTLLVTVSLSPERAVGGQLIPGDLVGVIASFDPFDITFAEPGQVIDGEGGEGIPIYVGSTAEGEPSGLKTPNSTHLILLGVTVTNVQVEQLPVEGEDAGADVPDLAPTGNLLVTLAVAPPEAERVIFTAEHGFLWLVYDDGTNDLGGTEIQTRETVYR
jgi:pilus assembly protein CpaB